MKYNKKQCPYCLEVFFDIEGRVFSNHVRWCKKNPDRDKTENIRLSVIKRYDEELGIFKDYIVKCDRCGKDFKIKEREKQFPNREKYFCSKQCCHQRPQTSLTKCKIAGSMTGKQFQKRQSRICLFCNKEFVVRITSKRKFCSKVCHRTWQKRDQTDKLRYRRECQFKFNVYHYATEFDLDLIKKYGWYKAKNHGDNLDGVSRDHKLSIDYGWANGISPEVIRHPANCQLILQRENSAKHTECSILLEQLLEAIQVWESKYLH